MARAGEATEAPTPRRIEEARRRGQVAYSSDLASSAALLAAVATLVAQGPASLARLLTYLRATLAAAPSGGGAGPALAAGLDALARTVAAPLVVAALTALAAGAAQTRGLFTLGAVRIDMARLSLVDGIGRVFGGRAALQIGKGLLKVAAVAAIVALSSRPLLGCAPVLAGAPVARVVVLLGTVAGRLAARIATVALAFSVIDYLLVRRRHLAGLRMTREEVTRESKEAEGDPAHRAERARLHRELLEQRMVADVRSADFVVVNPEHIAVALRYDEDGGGAPVVVARGERLVAARIKEVARRAGVPIFRNVGLARSLRELVEGDEIPVALYEAVAELLRAVYALEQRAEEADAPPSLGDAHPLQRPVSTEATPLPRGAGWKRV
jgi:flagellar biosynthesis protein FlhB